MTPPAPSTSPASVDHRPTTIEPPGTVPRRSLLKSLGLAGATLVVAGTGVLGYRVYDNGVLDPGIGDPYEAWTQWRSDPTLTGAVGAAILAANPHNTQPWIFAITDTSVDLFSDVSRRMPQTDPLAREHHVGLGCAIENLVLAARARGLLPTVELLPTAEDPLHLARVTVTTGLPAGSPSYDAIGERHSNRGPYSGAAVAAPTLAAYASSASDLPGISLRWFTSAADRAAMSSLMITAAQAVVDDLESSVEGFGWFRNNRDDIDRHRDGLTLDGQGMAATTLALAKVLPATSRVAGDQFWVEQTRTVHTATAAAYGVVMVADVSDVASRLAGGRLLQRIHLAATAEGLALQHMNQITERIDRENSLGMAPIHAPLFDALTASADLVGLTTFRLGHPLRAGRPSPRRPLGAVSR